MLARPVAGEVEHNHQRPMEEVVETNVRALRVAGEEDRSADPVEVEEATEQRLAVAVRDPCEGCRRPLHADQKMEQLGYYTRQAEQKKG